MGRQKNVEKEMKLNNDKLKRAITEEYRRADFNSMFGRIEQAEKHKTLGDWLAELKVRRDADE